MREPWARTVRMQWKCLMNVLIGGGLWSSGGILGACTRRKSHRRTREPNKPCVACQRRQSQQQSEGTLSFDSDTIEVSCLRYARTCMQAVLQIFVRITSRYEEIGVCRAFEAFPLQQNMPASGRTKKRTKKSAAGNYASKQDILICLLVLLTNIRWIACMQVRVPTRELDGIAVEESLRRCQQVLESFWWRC